MCGKGKGLSVWDLWGWLAGQEGRTGEHWAGALLPWPVSARGRGEAPTARGFPTLPLSSVGTFFWLGAWNGSS